MDRKQKIISALKKVSTWFCMIGIGIVLLAPFVPDFLYFIFYSDHSIYDYHFQDFRYIMIIPSVQIAGILLTAWGLVLKHREKDSNG